MTTLSKDIEIMGRNYRISGLSTDAYFGSLTSPHRDELLRTARFIIKPEDTVLDVGGNIGITSLFFSERAYLGKVLTFEPGVMNYRLLANNIAANRCANVQAINCAIGSSNGTLRFYESTQFGAGSFALGHDRQGAAHDFDPRLVAQDIPIRTIDSVVDDYGITRVDLIKIDVEGAERSVLSGAIKTVECFRPTVILEFNSLNQILYHDFSPLGFLEYLVKYFDQVFWLDRGSGRLTRVNTSAEINHFVLFNLKNGFVDNVLGTFEGRGISDETVPPSLELEFGLPWIDEGYASPGMVSRRDYDWLKKEYDRVIAGG
jgi:FkbM family methyltransferase